MVQDSLIHSEFFGSDHCPVELKIDVSKAKVIEREREEEKEERGEMEDKVEISKKEEIKGK